MHRLITNLFNKTRLLATVILVFIFYSQSSFASGLLTPKDGSTPALEIKEHHVRVIIEDGYAITSIEQVFYNPNNTDLEANYSFPLPNKAAVGEFVYWIDGQAVTGEVLEKSKAKKIYQQEKQAGREVAITTQDDYKTFDSLVYPVRAMQDVRIKLTYIQPAHLDTGIGRYVYPLEDGGVDEEKLSFWTHQQQVSEKFSFKLLFRSTYPIDQFRLPKHPQAAITQISAQEWSVDIINEAVGINEAEMSEGNVNNNSVFSLDQDIVVYWRLKPDLPGSVDLITYKQAGKDRGTFMMTVTPGGDLAAITEGRDWIFVLDYSGSMQGKYQSMIEGVNKGLANLNNKDRFKVIIFSDNADEITNGFVTATADNVRHWSTNLQQYSPNGSTNLYDGIELGLKGLDSDRSSAILLVTDGVANVGTTEKKLFLKLMQRQDVRLFTFVMGNSANRPLLESMVKVSNGFAINVSNNDDIVGQLMQATAKLTHQAFHDIDVKISGIKVKDLSPEKIGSLYHGQQLIVFGHYWGDGQAEVSISGKVSGQDKTYSSTFDFAKKSELNPEIERLWAFASIEDLQNKMDYFGKDADTEQAITDLAIDYGLVTNYTAMVVMRDEQFNARNIDRKNQRRVNKEQAARQQRKVAPVRNNRAGTAQPMYKNKAPSHSGRGGSFGAWTLLFMLAILATKIFKINERH